MKLSERKSYIKGVEPIHRGKTRDTYKLPTGNLLVVATDRISTHNIVHNSEIQAKGEVLTGLTIFWLTTILHSMRNHLLIYGENIHSQIPELWRPDPMICKRAIIVRKLEMIPYEFIFRNYLTGSLYKKFYLRGEPNPYGIPLRKGLKEMSPFFPAVFTPTDKSETDDPVNSDVVRNNNPVAYEMAIDATTRIQGFLRKVGIELIDTKFELGISPTGETFLADEIVTPDSSRFCEMSEIREGEPPRWFDKQIARDKAEEIWGNGPKTPIKFDSEIEKGLSQTYLDLFQRIVGRSLVNYQREIGA